MYTSERPDPPAAHDASRAVNRDRISPGTPDQMIFFDAFFGHNCPQNGLHDLKNGLERRVLQFCILV